MNDPAPKSARASNSCLRCGLVLGLLVGMCTGSALFLQSRSEDPDYVRGVLQELLPSTVPPGYKPARAFPLPLRNQQFVTLVPESVDVSGAAPGDVPFVINVNAIPQSLQPEEFVEKLKGWLADDSARKLKVESETPLTVQVRGGDVEALGIYGTLQTTQAPIRFLWVTLLQDPADPEQGWILISFMGTPERFDQEAVDAFLASVE